MKWWSQVRYYRSWNISSHNVQSRVGLKRVGLKRVGWREERRRKVDLSDESRRTFSNNLLSKLLFHCTVHLDSKITTEWEILKRVSGKKKIMFRERKCEDSTLVSYVQGRGATYEGDVVMEFELVRTHVNYTRSREPQDSCQVPCETKENLSAFSISPSHSFANASHLSRDSSLERLSISLRQTIFP